MPVLSQEIKKRAISLGFDKVGIAAADRLTDEANHLDEWLARRFHGTMSWMAKNFEKRIDPRNILPDARSVVAVAMNYYTDVRQSDDRTRGKVSRYAWGDDYHDVLHTRLERLLEFVKSKEPSAQGEVYVDTGPVMDKAWAQRAGIGWEGKHTNVITQEYGSWIFLGEVILNIQLEYDVPATDHCGSCTLCLDACPTDAIVEPYVLDSNRCISYLTIEYHGEISSELGSKFNGWIFGCDICQDVCPWNERFSTPTSSAAFAPRKDNIAPSLHSVVEMTQAEFNERFKGSAMKRTKLPRLSRNARVALSATTIEE